MKAYPDPHEFFESPMTPTDEQTILELTRHFTPVAMRLARSWSLDLDDVKQEIALIILETLPRIPDLGRDVKPYLYRTITTRFLSAHSEKYSHKPAYILSLDVPLPDHPGYTWADTLASPVNEPTDDTCQIEREQALYDALHRLRREEQEYLRRVYKLNAFKVQRRVVSRQRTVKVKRSQSSISANAFGKLRRDVNLAAAMEVSR